MIIYHRRNRRWYVYWAGLFYWDTAGTRVSRKLYCVMCARWRDYLDLDLDWWWHLTSINFSGSGSIWEVICLDALSRCGDAKIASSEWKCWSLVVSRESVSRGYVMRTPVLWIGLCSFWFLETIVIDFVAQRYRYRYRIPFIFFLVEWFLWRVLALRKWRL